MRRSGRRRLAALSGLAALLAAGAAPSNGRFRFERAVAAPPGWAVLEIPDDVLDACRPGLPDLRLVDAAGREVAFALDRRIARRASRLTLLDVETAPGRETLALADRGPKPGTTGAVSIEIADAEFLKPVVLEASGDRTNWREIARGSIFAAAGARQTALRFAPNDRRWFRIRLDDRNSDPVRPVALRLTGAETPGPRRVLRLVPRSDDAEGSSVQRLLVTLPARNLPLEGLHLEAAGEAFSRDVRVFERVVFRGEVSRRLLGDGRIFRGPGAADVDGVTLSVAETASRALEIEIDRGDAAPLAVAAVRVDSEPTHLVFVAPAGPLRLAYGSRDAAAPEYDLESALAAGVPAAARATLGAATETGAAPGPLDSLPRGGPLAVAGWRARREIRLPASGSVAYLDISPEGRAAVRLVDVENRPVPHLVERDARHVRRTLPFEARVEGTKTILEIPPLRPHGRPEALELVARSPAFFERDVVLHAVLPAREAPGSGEVARVRWSRPPGDAAGILTLSLDAARGSQATLRIEIENGENAPVAIASVTRVETLLRLDFVFRPGERLFLLTENPSAPAPAYDLALLADRVFAEAAEAAAIAEPDRGSPTEADDEHERRWLAPAVAVAGLLLLVVLARTVRRTDPKP